ncbi:YbfB/YjiJ family MFS transporter [Roseibium sp. CAU 1637]|uniref:YbfB/YjiJ family MFS transporter n=1 Tax=Roseibium limicola TaxID=2816037 RepID=A0A939ETX7_9HYPH|nr:YbfB/YjiJ family MFS transporter [Roseibium limicola]MBO0347029.1 YbfB/YjiJ family MFS transporter [Roseibium limicola]
MSHAAPAPSRLPIIKVYAGGIATQLLTIGIARFAYTPLLTVMQDQDVLSAKLSGWLGALIYVGYLLGAMILSVLRNPAIRLLLFRIGLVLAVLSTFAMGWTQNPWLWGFSRLAGGFAGAAGMLLAAEFILIWLTRNDLRPDLGPHYVGLGIGICLSGVVALALGNDMPWQDQWLVFGTLSVVLLPFAWGLTPSPDGATRKASANSHHSYAPATKLWFWVFGAGYLTAGWGYAVGATFSVDILTGLIGSNNAAVIIWIVLGLATAAGAIFGSVAARAFGIQRVLVVCMAGQTLSLAGYALSFGTIIPFIAAVLFGACFMAVVSLSLMLTGLKTPQNPGAGMARMTLLYGMGQIIGPATTGWLVAAHGTYLIALAAAVALMILGTGLTLWANKIE